MKIMSEVEFKKKVDDKILQNKVNDYVKDLKTQPQELPINIPDNPFMVDDGSDGIETDELNAKQNMLFMDYLKRNKYKNFGDWWEAEGKEEVGDIFEEKKQIMGMVRNTNDLSYQDWWKNFLRYNLNSIIDRLRFMQVWEDSIK